MTARVIKIDKADRRIGLSIKAANYSPEQLKAEQAVLDALKPGEDRPEPTREMIEAKFWEVYPRCRVKVLQEVKEGMIVVFHDLGEYPPGGFQELVDNPEEFLAKTFGKKKIKVNFYDGDNFVCTINFKVAGWTEHEGGH